MRYALLAAVSSPSQATPDKLSLETQQTACRQIAHERGWLETTGPYLIPGERRTRYVNLRDAEHDLPPLRALLDDAQAGRLDLLIIYDFTRLRDLIDLLSQALAAYGVQLYSTRQPLDPVPPEKFNRKISGTTAILQTVALLGSRTEIDTMTTRLQTGREARLTKGLRPSGRLPYGYQYAPTTGKRSANPLVIDPPAAALVVTMKDMYLAGKSVHQIIDYLREHHIPAHHGAPTWTDYSIRYILKNPFYAGLVGLGYHRIRHDPRHNLRKQIKNDTPIQQPGQHEPLWNLETHRAILDEMQRRTHIYKGPASQRLSHLLYCPEHHRPLYVKYHHGHKDDAHRCWYCPGIPGEWHLHLLDTDALALLTQQLTTDLQDIEHLIKLPTPSPATDLHTAALSDLLARRERLTDALETGQLDAPTYAKRTAAIDARLSELRAQQNQSDRAIQLLQQRQRNLNQLAQILPDLPAFITTADPQLVNTQLRTLIHRIHLHPGPKMEIEYR